MQNKVKELLKLEKITIMVVGQSDTGKTTFIRELVSDCPGKQNIAIVDLDSGQSTIGLPTTVSWCYSSNYLSKEYGLGPQFFFFTGTTSPAGNLSRHISGSKIVCDDARAKTQKIIIDTSGLIAPPYGTMLKILKIKLVQPDILLIIEKENEAAEIKQALKGQKKSEIITVPSSEEIRPRTSLQRALYRQKIFGAYFQKAKEATIDFDKIGLSDAVFRSGEPAIQNRSASWFANRIIGIENNYGNYIALGLIMNTAVDKENIVRSAQILTPIDDITKIAGICFGQIKLQPTGAQLIYSS